MDLHSMQKTKQKQQWEVRKMKGSDSKQILYTLSNKVLLRHISYFTLMHCVSCIGHDISTTVFSVMYKT